jgi:Na+-translocating ferredoxin:NAD+ oxidoreductase subunit A
MDNANELITVFVTVFLIQNIVLTQFLGLCSFFGVSNKESSALGMGLSVLFVITFSSTVTFLIYHHVLVPYELTHLRTLVFILVISAFVQILELFMKKMAPALHKVLGIYLPLITTNCAVLGVALLNIDNGFNFYDMIIFSVASAFGFTAIIYVFSFIREQMAKSPIVPALKGIPIALFTAGIMSFILAGFA